VNSAVNKAIQYREDSANWGVADYWASAAETIGRGAGDCEDYAIAKMQVLRASGVPANDMFLVVGNDVAARSAHAMLLVRLGDSYRVLDNFQDEVRADSEYRDFHPVITLSSAGRWLHGYPAGTVALAAAGRTPARPASSLGSGTLAAVIASQGGR
jgi:predicted transglutaminase-like cysteine proteinase